MNLKKLANQSLDIEKQLQEQFGVINVSVDERKIELLIHEPKDFLNLTKGEYTFSKRVDGNLVAELKHETTDFIFICYLSDFEVEELKELTK